MFFQYCFQGRKHLPTSSIVTLPSSCQALNRKNSSHTYVRQLHVNKAHLASLHSYFQPFTSIHEEMAVPMTPNHLLIVTHCHTRFSTNMETCSSPNSILYLHFKSSFKQCHLYNLPVLSRHWSLIPCSFSNGFFIILLLYSTTL